MLIVGIDEVGRGCLAGPVVAASVLLPSDFHDERVIDSKKLSAKKREELAKVIYANALAFGIGVVCSEVIDKINILNATKQAMQISLSQIKCKYDKVVIDAVKLNNLNKPFIHPNKADVDFIQVSAASIIAKVYRDDLMKYLATIHDQYGWEKNAGYGSKMHIEAIKKYGRTQLHRKSFYVKAIDS